MHAHGKYIAYLDADDKYSEETLENVCSFFDEHYNDIDEVTFPIVRYKNGKTLPLHYRYNYLTKTGIYDLKKYPYISQSNINIIVKNKKDNNILFDTIPNFRHEDQAYNSEMLESKMKIGFVKEAEYKYNRDNENSIIATYMHAFYIFETTTAFFEHIFNKYEDVPSYYQVQFFNDIVWKFAESKLWPYHYEEDEFAVAKSRILALLDKVDVDVIMNFPNADNYQKLYWLRQKRNITITPILLSNRMQVIVDGKEVYGRKDAEIILKRIVVDNNHYKIVGFYKSPLYSMVDKPDFYVLINGLKNDLMVNIASSSYFKAKERTDTFYGFEFESDVSVGSQEITFGFNMDGIDYETVFYNTNAVPFFRARTKKYASGKLIIEQKNNILIFTKANKSETKTARYYNHNRFKNNEKIYNLRLSAERYLEKRIWLYYDNFTVTFDNGYLQFKNDFQKKTA